VKKRIVCTTAVHYKLNNEKSEWMTRAFDWRNKKVRELGLDPTNPILLARANDRDIIDSCEDIKGHLQTHHEEIMRVTLAELKIADPNVSPECKEVALVSESDNQSTMTFETKRIIDRTGRHSTLNVALLEGNKGDAMLAVFDSGATRTVILRKLITNGNVELIEWGKDTSTQGLSNIQVGGQAAKVFIPAPETDPEVRELHPKVISVIHDGFNVVHHRARLYNTNQFLGFSGVFPTGMEPIYQLESHPRALHYADHPQQADHEMQSVFQEAASAHQNR